MTTRSLGPDDAATYRALGVLCIASATVLTLCRTPAPTKAGCRSGFRAKREPRRGAHHSGLVSADAGPEQTREAVEA